MQRGWIRSALIHSISDFRGDGRLIHKNSNRGSQIPERLLISTSKFPLKVKLSQGLQEVLKRELVKTDRNVVVHGLSYSSVSSLSYY